MSDQKISSDYAKEFGQKHPEVGELSRGDRISPEAFAKLDELLSGMTRKIEHKTIDHRSGGTTQTERIFVSTAADMLARTLYITVLQDHELLADPNVAKQIDKVISSAYMSTYNIPPTRGRLSEARTPDRIDNALDAVVDTVQRIHTGDPGVFKTHSSNLTDIIEGSVAALGAVAEKRGGFPITDYLQGNLQNILANYELVEAEQARAA